MNTVLKLYPLSVVLLAACASTPMGPTVQVMPGRNKPFQVFQQDQESCKQYAQTQVAGQADAVNQKAVGSAVLGTVLGGAFGAAVGNHQGAGVGGATGAIAGTAVGTNMYAAGQASIQGQYDNSYVQCMYSKGHQVPGAPPIAVGPGPAMASYPATQTGPEPSSAQGQTQAMPASQSMSIKQVQAKLNSMGFSVGRPDGVMGSKTREQLILFQKSRGIAETGEPDADTISAMNN
jgi:hypothetical protein